jgi:broad specificity phosphatase PhoE
MSIFIARHGQNEDNAEGILNGHRDRPLTELGRRQAMELALGIEKLGLRFSKVYSSPLCRALETAEIVASKNGLEAPEIVDSLIERDFGILTGRPHSDIPVVCGDNVIKTDTITYFLEPEGAETFPQLLERAKNAMEEIKFKKDEGDILVVCHGDLGKMLYAAATGTGWKEVLLGFHFGNGELIDIEQNGSTHLVKLEQFNI